MQEKKPLVSIVIPAYNSLPYLEEAIDSVLKQDYPHIELIVLDDGSTDNTQEFLKKYNKKFHYDKHANIGQAATLNKGWQLCKGQIIGYLSADDILEKNSVSLTVSVFINNPDIVLTYGDNWIIDNKSNIIRKHTAPEYDYDDFIDHAKCRIGVGSFFLKSIFDQIGGWDINYRLMPDYAYQLQLAKRGKFKYIPEILGYSRLHSQSLSAKKVSYNVANEFIVLMKSELKAINASSRMRKKILSKSYKYSAITHFQSKRYIICFLYLLISIILDKNQLDYLLKKLDKICH